MRILLAVDGSDSADRATDLVAALPWREGGQIRIVSVVPNRADALGVRWSLAATRGAVETESGSHRVHVAALETAEREIRSVHSNLAIEPFLLHGRAASRIVEEARSMAADLIVVGHRGQGRWESVLLGSVSAEVVDHAPCPVLVARDEHIGPVVLADDGSVYARAAELLMSGCPMFAGLPITVVSVIEDGFPDVVAVAPLMYTESMTAYTRSAEAEREMIRTECTAAAARLRAAGLDAESEVREGDPATEVIAAAAARRAGLIIVGTRGQTGLRRLILGSVARKILLHASCSVLVVRGGPIVPPPTTEGQGDRELVSPFG